MTAAEGASANPSGRTAWEHGAVRLEKEAERREDRRSVDVPEGRREGDLGERRDGERIYGTSVTRIDLLLITSLNSHNSNNPLH